MTLCVAAAGRVISADERHPSTSSSTSLHEHVDADITEARRLAFETPGQYRVRLYARHQAQDHIGGRAITVAAARAWNSTQTSVTSPFVNIAAYFGAASKD